MTNEEYALSLCASLGKEIALIIASARKEERERCAQIVRDFGKTNADGEFIVPKLGYWLGEQYIPDAEAIAAHIE